MTHINSLPESGYVRLPKVLSIIPVSRSTWYHGIKTGRFPKPIKLGPRIAVWRVKDVLSLIEKAES